MGISPGSKEKGELTLVFNIGSSSVGGALFFAQPSGVPKIIFTADEPIIFEDMVDIDRFLSVTIAALEIVTNKIYKSGLGAPKRIFCVLSPLWYISQTRIIHLEKNTPFLFTEKLADSLIQKEMKIFEEEHLAKFINDGNAVRVIELKNIKTILNGYETANPLQQKARELQMIVFISMSGEQILKKIENTVGKHFRTGPMQFSSFLMSSFTAVRDLFPKQENFLLIDIGGEVTDISMVKKSTLRESISFPLGRNFLARGISSILGCTINEASSFISLYNDGHADQVLQKKLNPIISQLKAEWLKKLQESLANLSNDISIPSNMYIAIDKDLASFFAETIKSEQLNQYTLTESKFEVVFLNTTLLHGVATFEDTAVREPFLIMDSVYINRFLTKI